MEQAAWEQAAWDTSPWSHSVAAVMCADQEKYSSHWRLRVKSPRQSAIQVLLNGIFEHAV